MNFYETRAGRRFFEQDLPRLTLALEQIAKALTTPKATLPKEMLPADPKFLYNLYYGEYEPSIFKVEKRYTALNQAVSETESALLTELQDSPAAMAALEAYQEAFSERDSVVLEEAFESGFRTAVQMIVAGLTIPMKEAHNG